jgi:gliding motility-associated-like protein
MTGVFVTTLTNQFGCDSVITETITLLPSDQITLTSASCAPADTGVFVNTLINQYGCDSIVTSIITLLPADATLLQSSSCIASDTGTFVQLLVNQHGCDSIVTSIIHFAPSDTTVLQSFTCDPDEVSVTGMLYSTTQGCDSLVLDIVALHPLPQVEIISLIDYAGFDVSCHAAADASIMAQLTGTGPFVYLWSTGDTSSQLSMLMAGEYQVAVTDANGCEVTDSITLIEPEPFAIAFQISPPGCFAQQEGSITVIPSGGVAPYTFALNGSVPQSDATFTSLTEGLYMITAFDANDCQVSEIIRIDAPIQVQVDLGSDQQAAAGDTILLEAIVDIPLDSISLISWTGISSTPCPTCLTQTIVPLVTTAYAVEVVSVDGCSDRDDMTIFIDRQEDIYVPNIFSPNGDGINDQISVFAGSDVREIMSWVIFDGWGNMVFQARGFMPNDESVYWDGNAQNKPLNPGVFTYRLDVLLQDGTTKVVYGDVTLLR